MTDLERRALLGDKQAQEECTRKGIMLPCPCCGGKPFFTCDTRGTPPEVIKVEWNYLIVCENCRLSSGMGSSFIALAEKWNTRPAPPIKDPNIFEGYNLDRCCDCAKMKHGKCERTGLKENPWGFCIHYEPRHPDAT